MEHSIALLREAYLQRLGDDNFHDLHIQDRPASIHQFVDSLTMGNLAMRHFGLSDAARFPDLTDLNMTFAEFMLLSIQVEDTPLPLSKLFQEYFCKPVGAGLVFEVAKKSLNTAPAKAALAEVGVGTWGEWASAIVRTSHLDRLAKELAEITKTDLADRTLLSFFIRSPIAGKFSMWGPWATTGAGRKLPTRVIECDGYSVSVEVARYEDVECDVLAYEWEATLTVAGASQPDAAAVGMVYVFEREDGVAVGGLEDLVIAADAMADSDVIQAKAFITQYDDAADVIETNDLCFVWLWDRRGGAAKGLGAKCLAAALQDLRRRFKKVRTVVFDARPGQFSNWTSAVDPPMVAVEKQTAVENLVGYIRSLDLNFDVRTIFARSDDSQREAVVAYSQAMDKRSRGQNDRESGDPDSSEVENDLNLDVWESEISNLLRLAGLGELADDLDDGDASDDIITAAVKHIIFDSSVHYLRPSSSGDFSPALIGMLEEVPHEQAHEEIRGMDEFCQELPDNMLVRAVYWLDDYAVCTVEADTPFGALTEYFTLVRKPRAINVENFFRNIS